jgi:hypothetical protein
MHQLPTRTAMRRSVEPGYRRHGGHRRHDMSASRLLRFGIAALVLGVFVTLAGVHTQLLSLLLIGTIVSGAGFGATLSGAMRTLMPLAPR